MSSETASLYLGFDLSTQQLKGTVINSDLRVRYEAKFDFDKDSRGFNVHKGVMTNDAEHEVFAPVALWLQALDTILALLKEQGLEFGLLKGISGAGQQHGSVFWAAGGIEALEHLDASKTLEEQLKDGFVRPYSPNWQDTSTQAECEEFDKVLGSREALADATGSSAHHRFTGPQILRFQKRNQEAYRKTARISLISSFLASLLLGKIAPIDIGDVCGMNLWDVKEGRWHEQLLDLASKSEKESLFQKLGGVPESGGDSFGSISPYFVERYGVNAHCQIIPFTGDNPATILSLPLRPMDAIVSLGTSTTFLMSTPEYQPDPAVHFMNHPTTPGLYMFMLCYKNGGLAREKLRDAINRDNSQTWDNFNQSLMTTPRLGIRHPVDTMKLGLFFPRPEIVPPLAAGTYRYTYDAHKQELLKAEGDWWTQYETRAMVEGQILSLRLRSKNLVRSPEPNPDGIPPQPRRIYLVGGGSKNPAIAKVISEVLGGREGVYRLDVGDNACALGAAYKAVWGCEKQNGESFEDLIGKRWREEDFAVKIEDGYQGGYWERYGIALEGFERMEKVLLEEQGRRS